MGREEEVGKGMASESERERRRKQPGARKPQHRSRTTCTLAALPGVSRSTCCRFRDPAGLSYRVYPGLPATLIRLLVQVADRISMTGSK